MSYSQFIMAVFAIYVVYYAANILYDAFLKQSKTNTGEEEDEKKESEQNYVSVNESIEMEVETQGIPMEQLLAKGKSMFSHVNFNK